MKRKSQRGEVSLLIFLVVMGGTVIGGMFGKMNEDEKNADRKAIKATYVQCCATKDAYCQSLDDAGAKLYGKDGFCEKQGK